MLVDAVLTLVTLATLSLGLPVGKSKERNNL
jgi:hypothetical protein